MGAIKLKSTKIAEKFTFGLLKNLNMGFVLCVFWCRYIKNETKNIYTFNKRNFIYLQF